jgi:hypothetical protein
MKVDGASLGNDEKVFGEIFHQSFRNYKNRHFTIAIRIAEAEKLPMVLL